MTSISKKSDHSNWVKMDRDRSIVEFPSYYVLILHQCDKVLVRRSFWCLGLVHLSTEETAACGLLCEDFFAFFGNKCQTFPDIFHSAGMTAGVVGTRGVKEFVSACSFDGGDIQM